MFVLRPSVAEAAKHGFGNRDWKVFMSRAIAGYKRQDDAAARVWDEAAYATVDSWWALMREASAACFHCGQSCDMMGDSTATLDRVVGTDAFGDGVTLGLAPAFADEIDLQVGDMRAAAHEVMTDQAVEIEGRGGAGVQSGRGRRRRGSRRARR